LQASGIAILKGLERRGRAPCSKISPTACYWVISVFVTPDLQISLADPCPVHATLAKVIHGSEFAGMTIVRMDAIVAKSAQLTGF
jgi:hypothetical protein